MLALGLHGGRVVLVDEATGEEKWAVQAHSLTSWTEVAMSPGTGRFVASVGSRDEHWKLWDAASGALHRAGATHDGTGACICAVNDLGQRSLREGCPVVAHTKGLHAVVFSPCEQRLATGGKDGTVIVWDAQTGHAAARMQGGGGGGFSLSFSADGARLACGTDDGSIHVWEASGAMLHTIPAAQSSYSVHSVQFSPTDSRSLASAGGGQLVHLWDVESGEKKGSFEGGWFVEFSPDGRCIATASASSPNQVKLFNLESGALRFRIIVRQGFLYSASFSFDDGSKIASGSRDGTCKVWDSSTEALIRTINAGAEVRSIAWGRNWVGDTAIAFAMGQHLRLGAGSQVLELEVGVVRMILDRV